MAVSNGFGMTFANNQSRITSRYARNLWKDLNIGEREEFLEMSPEDILLGKFNPSFLSQTPDIEDKFHAIKGKFHAINLAHSGYIEVRVAGYREGFEMIKDRERLERFLYDAISQIYQNKLDYKKQTIQEVYRVIKQSQRVIRRLKEKQGLRQRVLGGKRIKKDVNK
jgi:hypothetical protein